MVIFHSYVSLPDGTPILGMIKAHDKGILKTALLIFKHRHGMMTPMTRDDKDIYQRGWLNHQPVLGMGTKLWRGWVHPMPRFHFGNLGNTWPRLRILRGF